MTGQAPLIVPQALIVGTQVPQVHRLVVTLSGLSAERQGLLPVGEGPGKLPGLIIQHAQGGVDPLQIGRILKPLK